MNPYLRLLGRTFGISTSTMLMYRSNIVFFLIFETLFLAAQFLAVSVGYDLAGHDIAGWTRQEAYLLTAVNTLSHQCFICFFINPIFSVSTQVWNGQYDYILLKPLHPLASMFFNGQFVISNLPNLVFCFFGLSYVVATMAAPVSWGLIAVFAVFLLAGLAVRIALALLCMSPIFFSERMADVEDSYWSVASLGKYQLEVYPWYLRWLFTFGLPLGMMASLPSRLLTQPSSVWSLSAAFLCSLAFVVASGAVFMACLRRYQSVNSGV